MSIRGDFERPARGSRILRRRQLPPGLAVAAALLFSACHLTGSFQTGPEGQSMHDTDLRRLAREEQFEEALDLTDPDDSDEIGDELLRLMQRGLLLHYAGQYEESNELLQEAERVIDDRYTKSVSRALLSVVSSDRALAWLPSDTERLMVNYYGALNYLALGDLEGAEVEARRLSRLLQLEDEGDEALRPDEIEMRKALRYFAGSVFEAAGNSNDAAVSYRHVWAPADDLSSTPLRPRFLDLWGEDVEEPGIVAPVRDIDFVVDSVLAAHAAAKADAENASLARSEPAMESDSRPEIPVPPPVVDESAPPPVDVAGLIEGGHPTSGGDVVVFVELGLVAHRVERSVNVPVFPEEAEKMQSSDTNVRFATASCVASRSFTGRYDFAGLLAESGTGWQAGADGRCAARPDEKKKSDKDDDEGSDRQVYLLRVAWPEMVPSGLPTDLRISSLAVTSDVQLLQLAELDALPDTMAVPEPGEPLDSVLVPGRPVRDAEPETVSEVLRARPAMTGPVSGAVTEEFEDMLGGILIKAVVRSAIKYELARGLEKGLSDEDEVLGDIAFYAANAAAALFERADTRSWHLLPDRVQIVRLWLPDGIHPLTLQVDAGDGVPRSIDLGAVRVREGSVQVLAARVWP